jgi:hypothetical protein
VNGFRKIRGRPGLNTVAVARMHGVSKMIVYFIRQDLLKAWKNLFGEEAV